MSPNQIIIDRENRKTDNVTVRIILSVFLIPCFLLKEKTL